MKKILTKLWYVVVWLGILTGFILCFIILYWQLYPYQPLVFTQPTIVLNKEVYGGDKLLYKTSFCKYMDLPALLTKLYVDTVVYPTDPKVANNRVGCQTLTSVNNVPNLPTGKYQMRLIYQYKVNPIRTITITEYTESFIIKEATHSAEQEVL